MNYEGVDILVEVKLGYTPEILDHAADTLKRFDEQLEQDTVLLVVTSGGPAHRRADGCGGCADRGARPVAEPPTGRRRTRA